MRLIIISFVIHQVYRVDSWFSNVTTTPSVLPTINEGDTCVAGNLYKLSCNTCRCGQHNALICTKMACLGDAVMSHIKNKKAAQNLRHPDGKSRRSLAARSADDCVPGTISKSGCHLCYCDDNQKSICSEEECTQKLSYSNVLKRLDDSDYFRLIFHIDDVQTLPSLAHLASACEPGRSYRVDCNACVCLASGNLMCTKDLCITSEGLVKVAAFEKSDKPCNAGFTLQSKCIQCDCVDGKTKCSMIPDCKQSNQLLAHSDKKIKKRLDLKRDDCTPMMVYRIHCNKCYCQRDGSLRCTQKTCLTHSETVKLKAQRMYLERNGL